MNLEPHGVANLTALTAALRDRQELDFKRDIQLAAATFGRTAQSAWFPSREPILNGDDAAPLPDGEGGYVLFAAEGMRGELIAQDPWFAGYASVLVNVNDIAAMGGRPWAVVDAIFLDKDAIASGVAAKVLEGMQAASLAFGVPVVGGHTTRDAPSTALAVAIVGRAKKLISSAAARPGQKLLAAIDLRGSYRGAGGNFNAATSASSAKLRAQLEVLPDLAERGLVSAGKDISMAGVCGTLWMMLEAAGCGASLDLAAYPAPEGTTFETAERWLTAFPSFGFLLAVDAAAVAAVTSRFNAVGVTSAVVGEIDDLPRLELRYQGQRALFSDLQGPFTGFGDTPCLKY